MANAAAGVDVGFDNVEAYVGNWARSHANVNFRDRRVFA